MSKVEATKVQPAVAKEKDQVTAAPEVKAAVVSKPEPGESNVVQIKQLLDREKAIVKEIDVVNKKLKNVVEQGRALEIKESEAAATDTVDDIPTDRQVRNARRVLEAVGLDVDSQVNKAVAEALSTDPHLGQVVVDGVPLEPLQTDLMIQNRFEPITLVDGKVVHLPYLPELHKRPEGIVFSVFKYSGLVQGSHHFHNEVYYFVDAASKVVITSLSSDNMQLNRNRNGDVPGGILYLVGSTSTNDIVIGASSLINAKTCDCILNQSDVHNTDDKTTYEQIPSAGRGRYAFSPSWPTGEAVIRLCLLKEARIINSKLAPGHYSRVTIQRSTIASPGNESYWVNIKNSYVRSSVITGRHITLTSVNLECVTLECSGNSVVTSSSLENIRLRVSDIFICNKFNILEVDVPDGSLIMYRRSATEIEIFEEGFDTSKKVINIDASCFDVSEAVRDVMSSRYSAKGQQKDSVIKTSIERYITHSIHSRLRVIRMLNEAVQMVEQVQNRAPHYDQFENYYAL